LQFAQAFRLVAQASASLQRLDPEAVLDAVVDGVMSRGEQVTLLDECSLLCRGLAGASPA
jgi:hypothetical protein